MVFGFEGARPEGAVGHIIEGCVAMLAGCVAEVFEGGLHCFRGVWMGIGTDGKRDGKRWVRTDCAYTAHA